MDFYKLTFHSIPNIRFAHRYSTSNYYIQFYPTKNVFEITCVEKGDVIQTTASGVTTQFEAPCIKFFTVQDESCELTSDAPLHQHLTIGVEADFTLTPVTIEDILLDYQKPTEGTKELFAYVTSYINDKAVLDSIRTLITKIILNSHSNTDVISNYADLMSILSIFNHYCVEQALQKQHIDFSYGDILYCRKTIDYIMKNIHKKICVEDIAKMLDISSGHLSRIFKSVMNMTIIEYSNQQKINYVKELLDTKNLKTAELIELIGFSDEKYLSRMFKKYTNMTITEYKQSHTFLYKKPHKNENS